MLRDGFRFELNITFGFGVFGGAFFLRRINSYRFRLKKERNSHDFIHNLAIASANRRVHSQVLRTRLSLLP